MVANGGRPPAAVGDSRLELLVAGRSLERAKAFRAGRRTVAKLVPAMFDRNGELAPQLDALRPHLLVDASGPFQAYGSDRYRVVEPCIARGIHYLDLADGADFVEGI